MLMPEDNPAQPERHEQRERKDHARPETGEIIQEDQDPVGQERKGRQGRTHRKTGEKPLEFLTTTTTK
jgi:hypothetical protein